MAAQDEDEQTESAGATIWPPPPTSPPIEEAAPRRALLLIPLPFPQTPQGFALPDWAKAARNYLFIAFMIVLLLLHSVVGKVMVGFLVVLLLLCLASFIFCMAVVAVMFVGRKFNRTTEVIPPQWGKDIISAMGGWMGMVPSLMFLVWGLSYLDVYHIHGINLVALAVWGTWFLLGCGAAVVNGVSYWLREWRTSS